MSSTLKKYIHPPVILVLCLSLLVSICAGQDADVGSKQPTTAGVSQLATSILSGIVVDENDAVVPDATVLVKDTAGGLEVEAITASDGSFIVRYLSNGLYTISVQRAGFSTAEVRNVAIRTNDVTALKIRLKVGEIGETVTVVAEPLSTGTYTPPGITVDRGTIESLPLNGRSLQSLILLAPGTVATRTTFSEQGQLSSNGQRANSNYFMVDGVSANIGVAAGATGTGQSGAGSLPGMSVMGTTNTLVSIDSLQELKILTNAFAPEFGRTPGAQILLTTRSGTNKFHGSLFEYFRSDVFGANDWFTQERDTNLPASRVNNFGGVFGGPIIKDRTFFFFSYEGLSGRLPQFATSDVPSLIARQTTLPALLPYVNSFPIPNGPVQKNPVLAEFSADYVNTASFNATSFRVDQKLSDKLTLFGRYNYAPSEITQRGVGSSLNNTLTMAFNTSTLTVGATHVLSPRLVNEARFNFSRSSGVKSFGLDDFGGAIPLDTSTVFPPFATDGTSFYRLSLGGDTSINSGRDASSFQDQINILDNVSLTFGSHQVKLGFDYRRLTSIYDQWKYRENAEILPNFAALQYGIAETVVIGTQDRTAINFTNISVYAQDTWRPTRRLSLTYGMRWDYNPPPIGDTVQSLFTVEGLNQPGELSLAEVGTPLYQATFNNFAPRFGFAYQLSEKRGREIVLRGGFGIFYDLGTGPLGNSASSFPYQRRRSYDNVYYPLGTTYQIELPYTQELPVSLIRVAQPDLKLPRVMQWNFGVEQSLGPGQTLSVSYVGSSGTRLLRTELLSAPNPDFEQVFVTTNKASSTYNALQVQFQRRLSKGFQAIASYTWANSIDIASNDSSANLPSFAGYDAALDRGPSDFDVRHSFKAALSYDIPALLQNGFGKALLSNWSIEGMFNARSAAPVEIFSTRPSTFGPFRLRPDLIAGVPLYVADNAAPGGRRINPEAFAIPTDMRQGSLGRNTLRGFPFTQFDVALNRRISLFEKASLQFRVEVFNLFNHPNFGDPIGDLGDSQFGRSSAMLGRSLTAINNTGFNPLFQAGGPRAVQFSLKLQF